MKLSMNDLLVLSALSREDKYGLDIIRTVEEAGTVLHLGGLYTILRRLEKQGLIKGYYREETEDRAGNRRRYYHILAAGDTALAQAQSAFGHLWGLNMKKASLEMVVLAIGFIIILNLLYWTKLIPKLSKKDNTPPQANSFFRSKLKSLRFLLPKKYREEILGDLMEIKNSLQKEGHGKVWTAMILFIQAFSIGYSMLRFKLGELYDKKASAKKEEEVIEELELKPLVPDQKPPKNSMAEDVSSKSKSQNREKTPNIAGLRNSLPGYNSRSIRNLIQ